MKSFKPDIKAARQIAKERLKKYFSFACVFLIIELITILCVWNFASARIAKLLGIPLIVLHLLVTISYLLFFDLGAARQLKKQNYQINNINSVQDGQTFFYALKYSGILRLILNLIITVIILIVILIMFY